MGFRTGAFAKVWEVIPKSDVNTKLRISVSRKNKETGKYEQDFSGYAMAIGSAAAKKASCLKEGDKIKLGDVDVSTRYDKEKKITYANYKVFSFELDDGSSTTQEPTPPPVDEWEIDDTSHRLPF